MDTINNDCRVCNEPGQYNIFQDELCFDSKSKSGGKTKIYICMNNFLFEKLYGEDEHSSFICQTCCNSLCDSYSFLLFVRKAEQNNWKIPESKIATTEQMDEVEIVQEQNEVTSDDFTVTCDDDMLLNDDDEDEDIEEQNSEKEMETFTAKKQKLCTSLPEYVKFTHYELQLEKKTVSLNIEEATLTLPKSGKYVFDMSFLNHQDSSLVYQCKFCIKAFSNSKFLVNHVCSVHMCLLCMEISENYKANQAHMKNHEQIVCPIDLCRKVSESHAAYRLHLKKQHLLQLPSQIGVLTENKQ